MTTNDVMLLDISSIHVDETWNPRKEYDGHAKPQDGGTTLKKLAESIKKRGLLQPLVVRRDEKGAYHLVAGFRRMRALVELGEKVAPVTVKELSEEDALIDNVVENVQRETLSPAELADALFRLSETLQDSKGKPLSGNAIGARVGLSGKHVNNLIRIRRMLIDEIWADFSERKISIPEALAAVGAGPEAEAQLEALHRKMGLIDDSNDPEPDPDPDPNPEPGPRGPSRPGRKEVLRYEQAAREMAKDRLERPSAYSPRDMEMIAKALSWAGGKRQKPPFAVPKVDSGEEE